MVLFYLFIIMYCHQLTTLYCCLLYCKVGLPKKIKLQYLYLHIGIVKRVCTIASFIQSSTVEISIIIITTPMHDIISRMKGTQHVVFVIHDFL